MASNITEFFGYSPTDHSPKAKAARASLECPFLEDTCSKKLHKLVSGVCTIKQITTDPVIICPVRLYAGDYQILKDVASQSFGDDFDLIVGDGAAAYKAKKPGKSYVVVFGKRWGKELRLPNRSQEGKKAGGYFVDWILAHIDHTGKLLSFVAVEVQAIDTTGNYQDQRAAYLAGHLNPEQTSAGLNWENVNKRILPQIIYKGHVLRKEPLCHKGLFFICPTPVYHKITERLGGKLSEIHQQSGSLTIMWYDIGPEVQEGRIRKLVLGGQATTTIDEVALAFTAPKNLPPARVYEKAIRSEL